jgi:hypothetical protein
MLRYVMLCYIAQFNPSVGTNSLPNTTVNVEVVNKFSFYGQSVVIWTGWILSHLVCVGIGNPAPEFAPSDYTHLHTVHLFAVVGCPHKMSHSNTAPKSKSS